MARKLSLGMIVTTLLACGGSSPPTVTYACNFSYTYGSVTQTGCTVFSEVLTSGDTEASIQSEFASLCAEATTNSEVTSCSTANLAGTCALTCTEGNATFTWNQYMFNSGISASTLQQACANGLSVVLPTGSSITCTYVWNNP